MICDKNCYACKHADCINDEMDEEDYREAERREELLRSEKQKKEREVQRKSRSKHREKRLEYYRAYYAAHREHMAACHKKWQAENKNKVKIHHQRYMKKNRGQYAQKQRALRTFRKALGLTQKEVGKLLGVSASTVGQWERGLLPCKMDAVMKRLQE